MTRQGRVYCLGDANLDVLLPIESYPAAGEDRRSDGIVLEVGGSVTNSAILLGLLGLPTALLSCLGQDLFGDFVVQALQDSPLDLSRLRRTDQADTGMMFIPVSRDGQRTLFGHRGANRHFNADFLPDLFDPGGALLLSGYALLEAPQSEAAWQALQRARQAELFIALDTAFEPPLIDPEAFERYLQGLDLLVLGSQEACKLTGETEQDQAIYRLLDYGIGTIGLKLGSAGSRLISAAEQVDLPAFSVETVDTTGAGDNFSAGLLYGLTLGMSLTAAGLLATSAAAHIVSVWGAGRQAASPNRLLQVLLRAKPELTADLQSAAHELQKHLESLASPTDESAPTVG